MSDYSSTYPTQSPTFAFDAKAGKLDSRLSYSRSSSGTYLSSEKALSSENLLLQSQDFDTSWSNLGLATSGGLTGGQTAPDGSASAFQLTAVSAASAMPAIYQSGVSVTATTHTAVVHLKSGTATHGVVSIRSSSGNVAYAMVDFGAGTVSNGHFGTSSNSSSTITALGSDWFKITLTATYAATTAAIVYIGLSDGTAPNSSGYWFHATSGETMFAWGAQLSSTNSKVYDSPTTTQISRSYSPLLKTASADEPRFEYAADGQSDAKGLLIESSASNLLPYGHNGYNSSNNFSMTLVDLIASQNAAVSPSGLLDATLLTDTGGLTQHRIDTTVSGLDSSKKYTLSGYFKATGTTTGLSLRIASGNTNGAEFNFSTGYVSAYGVAPQSYTFEQVGNGWVRVSITAPLGNSTATIRINTGRGDVQADDYSGMFFYGLQFEEGSAPSSVLLTSGSALSRASDSCSVDLSQINYSGGDTSVIVDIPAGTGNGHLPYLFDLGGSNVEQIAFYKASFNASASTNWSANAAGNGLSMSGSSASGTLGLRVSTNNFRADSSNSAAVTDNSITVSPWTSLHLGSTNAGNYRLNGHIKRLALYNVALSDTELQALTS